VALLRAKAAVGKLKDDNSDIQAGINICSKRLRRWSARSSRTPESRARVGKINENKSETYGFDADRAMSTC
jgi:chaperonin GroEL